MSESDSVKTERPVWFVGASFGGKEDQFDRFISEGIWEIDTDKYVDIVRSVQPGDSIVLKSRYTRKNSLPFDNKGQTVAVMAIKAIGKVTENKGNGHELKVKWSVLDKPREWYGYIYWCAITPVHPGRKETDNLIAFALEGVDQDFAYFLQTPYWKNRFDEASKESRFGWTTFYESFADKLLAFKDNRAKLLEIVYRVADNVPAVASLTDTYRDGAKGPLRDICPFTTIGIFNRNQTLENRRRIAAEFAKELNINESVPPTFDGVPTLHGLRTWLFRSEQNRELNDIQGLWNIFESGLHLAENDDDENRDDFLKKYNIAAAQGMVGWNLTMGLYWCRPWYFPTLDGKSRPFIEGKLNIKIEHTNLKGYCSANEYLALRDTLDKHFQDPSSLVGSFPELSFVAWNTELPPAKENDLPEDDKEVITVADSSAEEKPVPTYTVEDIMNAGCFLDKERLAVMVDLLRAKKNIILQGAPGTGKTWLAKKLAYALLGVECQHVVHPPLSFEAGGFLPRAV